jgi:small subunit ribosomal protein S2
MRELQKMQNDGTMDKMLKKEVSVLRRELTKLERNLGGIAAMEKKPGALFVVDLKREHLALAEAARLNIPIVALVDTNADPDLVNYPIPGNDDSLRSIGLISDILGETIKAADAEYTAKAKAEREAREAAEAIEREKAKAAREERQKNEAGQKKKREEVLKKIKEQKKKADEVKKTEAAAAKAAEKVEEAKVEVPAAEEKAPVAEEAAPVAEEVKEDAPVAEKTEDKKED